MQKQIEIVSLYYLVCLKTKRRLVRTPLFTIKHLHWYAVLMLSVVSSVNSN